LEALESVPPTVEWDDVEQRVESAPLVAGDDGSMGVRRHRLLMVAASVIFVGLLVVVLVAVTRPAEDDPELGTEPPVPAPTNGEATTTQPAQQTIRAGAVTAWTGDRYLVWGGQAGDDSTSRADGWILDPVTGDITPIPPAPIAPRHMAAGVWTGTELIVCCGIPVGRDDAYRVDDAAAFDPARNTWRMVSAPPARLMAGGPVTGRWTEATWTGSEMVVVATEWSGDAVAAYDPQEDRWRPIDPPPSHAGRVSDVAWTGEELLLWARTTYPGALDGGLRLDPASGIWSEMPRLPGGYEISWGSMAWTGDEVVVWGPAVGDDTDATGASWRPGDDTWRPLPDPGLPSIDWYEGTPGSQTLVWDDVNQRVILWPTHGGEWWLGVDDGSPGSIPLMAYDQRTDTWARLIDADLGWAPDLTAGGGYLLRPDEADPIVLRP
jgi:hypothetical protein